MNFIIQEKQRKLDMRVQTCFIVIDYGYGVTKRFSNLSRVALERYRKWYKEDSDVIGIFYGLEV
mgnify:CR=1 FL=1